MRTRRWGIQIQLCHLGEPQRINLLTRCPKAWPEHFASGTGNWNWAGQGKCQNATSAADAVAASAAAAAATLRNCWKLLLNSLLSWLYVFAINVSRFSLSKSRKVPTHCNRDSEFWIPNRNLHGSDLQPVSRYHFCTFRLPQCHTVSCGEFDKFY